MAVLKSTEIQDRINQLTADIQGGGSDFDQTQRETELEQKKADLINAFAEEARQRESLQAQAEQIGGLKEILQDIFEAAFPKDETVKLIGLTEYEDTRETFNKLVDQAVDENQTSLYAAFQQLIDFKDQKYSDLSVQLLESQKSLEVELEISRKLEKSNESLAIEIDNKNEFIASLEGQVKGYFEKNDLYKKLADTEIERLNEHIFVLQKQIASFQTVPQTIDFIPVAASESLSDRIAKEKVNSKLKLANVKAIGANWVEGINSEGNKEVAHVNDVEPVYQFPDVEYVKLVMETDEATPEVPFQIPTADSQGDSSLERNESLDESVGPNEESEVITLESLHAKVIKLEYMVYGKGPQTAKVYEHTDFEVA